MIGQIISHYRIESLLGRGGMGEVYRALDLRLQRQVALKFISSDLTRDTTAKARFVREAQAASALDHPNICTIHEIGEADDGRLFIAMACYDGQNLRRKLAAGPLPASEALQIGRQIAEGLAQVHRQGIIHRDIKPVNIIVTRSGLVKIVDFGLAKLVSAARITQTGVTMGTVAYMSPEQTYGQMVDHRSDIWSLGVVLYEMLTGRLPFAGDSTDAIIHSIRHDAPPPPDHLNAAIGRRQVKCLRRCLQKDPVRRYQRAEETAADLGAQTRRFQRDEKIVADPGDPTRILPGRRRRRRWLLRAALVVPVLLAVAVASHLLLSPRGGDRQPTSSLEAAPVYETRQVTTCGSALCPLWSGDGRKIIFGDDDGLHVISPEGGTSQKLPIDLADAIPWNMTPDGLAVLVHAHRPEEQGFSIWRVPLASGEARQVLENGIYGDLSPDGRRLLFTRRTGPQMRESSILCHDLTNGQERRIVTHRGPGTAVYKPQWSPDGKRIAYVRWEGAGHVLWVCDSDGSQDREVPMGPMHVGGHFCWTADGSAILSACELYGLWSIWRIPVDGGHPKRLTEATELTYHASLSPDQSSLAFCRRQDLSRILITPTGDGSLEDRLHQSAAVRNPAFSAAGTTLYYQALVNGRWQIWALALEEEDGPRLLISDARTSCAQPVPSDSGCVYFVQSDLRPESVFGSPEWNRHLFRWTPDADQPEIVPQAGNRVSRLVGERNGQRGLLLTTCDQLDEETLYYMDAEGYLHEIMRDSGDSEFYGFTWGNRPGEVYISHGVQDVPTTVVSVLDIESGRMRLLLSLGELAKDGIQPRPGGNAWEMVCGGDCLFMAVYQVDNRFPAIVEYHLKTGSAKIIVSDVDGRTFRSLDVSPDGSCLALNVSSFRQDVFVARALARSGLENQSPSSTMTYSHK